MTKRCEMTKEGLENLLSSTSLGGSDLQEGFTTRETENLPPDCPSKEAQVEQSLRAPAVCAQIAAGTEENGLV